MTSLMPQGKQQYLDANGNPLAGGKLYTYASGTDTPLATYTTAAGNIENTNPVVLNARGEANIFWGGSAYKVVLKDASDVEIYTQDNLQAPVGASDLASYASGKGAALIGFDGGTVADFFKTKNNRVVDSITALRALDKTKFTRAFVTGYYAAGGQGGGEFWYDSTDTTSIDNGGTIIVASDGARWKRVDTRDLTVVDFGADKTGVADAVTAFSNAAKTIAAQVDIQGAEAAIARAPVVFVRVPAGSFTLGSLVDVGNRQVIWVVDQGAVITGYANLNGKLWRDGQRVIGDHHGTSDYACGFTVRSHADLESGSEVLGVSAPGQIATYTDRDSVAMYVENNAPAAMATIATATYTATTVVPGTALTADQVKKLRVGMIIDTAHATKWSGFITAWAANGSSITVSNWYQAGGGGASSVPTDGTGAYVNPFTKVWAHNANVFLEASSLADQASGFELGSFNNKAAPGAEGANPKIWGYDSVNLGAYKCESAFIARGTAGWFHGYESQNCDVGYYQTGNGIGFKNKGNGTIFQSLRSDGVQNFVLTTTGSMDLGATNVTGPVFIDFHTTGVSNDYDVRIIASGGSGIDGAGDLTLNAGSVIVPKIVPGTDNTFSCGSATNRWSVVYAATGTINTSDARDKRDLRDIDETTALSLLGAIDAKSYRWVDTESPARVLKRMTRRQKVIVSEETYEDDELEIVGGVAVLRKVTKTRQFDQPVYEEIPVVDENGRPVVDMVGKGVMKPRVHRVPVMEEVEEEIELAPAFHKENVRTHFGFIAQDIEKALAANGLTTQDFAGLVIDKESGKYGLRYEQVLTILWPVVKGLIRRINDLEAAARDGNA